MQHLAGRGRCCRMGSLSSWVDALLWGVGRFNLLSICVKLSQVGPLLSDSICGVQFCQLGGIKLFDV